MADFAVTDEQCQAYERDGAVLLAGAFRDYVELLRAGIERNIAAPSEFERIYEAEDDGGRFFNDYCSWQRIPEYREFVLHSPAGRYAAKLMSSRRVRVFHEHVLVKERANAMVTPWHQDQPYYIVDGRQSVSFWIALDVVSRDVALEFVAGAHAWGSQFRPKRFNGQDLYENDQSVEAPDIASRRDEYDILGWAMEPGDAVAFSFRSLHGAPANPYRERRRRAFSLRLTGDDAVFAKRKGRTSPPFPDLEFEDGAPFQGPDFPVIYDADSMPGEI